MWPENLWGVGTTGQVEGASALDHLMACRPGKSQPFALFPFFFFFLNKKMMLVNLKGTHCSIMAILATAFYFLQMPLTSWLSLALDLSGSHFAIGWWVFLNCSPVSDAVGISKSLPYPLMSLPFPSWPTREKTSLPFNIHVDSPRRFFCLFVFLVTCQHHYSLHTLLWTERVKIVHRTQNQWTKE